MTTKEWTRKCPWLVWLLASKLAQASCAMLSLVSLASITKGGCFCRPMFSVFECQLTEIDTWSSPVNLGMYLSPLSTSDLFNGLKRHITLMVHSAGSTIFAAAVNEWSHTRQAPAAACYLLPQKKRPIDHPCGRQRDAAPSECLFSLVNLFPPRKT